MNTGRVWRKDDAACWVGVVDGHSVWTGPTCTASDTRASITKAIAAGPDLDDAATLGVLLGDGSVGLASGVDAHGGGWYAKIYVTGRYQEPVTRYCPTRAEAIARAWLAANEVAK